MTTDDNMLNSHQVSQYNTKSTNQVPPPPLMTPPIVLVGTNSHKLPQDPEKSNLQVSKIAILLGKKMICVKVMTKRNIGQHTLLNVKSLNFKFWAAT